MSKDEEEDVKLEFHRLSQHQTTDCLVSKDLLKETKWLGGLSNGPDGLSVRHRNFLVELVTSDGLFGVANGLSVL